MILCIYGKSKSGKTSLIERISRDLGEDGFSVAAVKHIKQEGFTMDTRGKDTWRFSEAGADPVVACSDNETSFLLKRTLKLEEILRLLEVRFKTDVILVEGFRGSGLPKVAVGNIEEEKNTLFRYEGNVEEIVRYIKSRVEFERISRSLPGLDCEECGMKCTDFAAKVQLGERSLKECRYLGERYVNVKVDDKQIPVKSFPARILGNVIAAMLTSLKGVKEFKRATIELRGSWHDD